MLVHLQQMFDIRKQLKAELKVREEMVGSVLYLYRIVYLFYGTEYQLGR